MKLFSSPSSPFSPRWWRSYKGLLTWKLGKSRLWRYQSTLSPMCWRWAFSGTWRRRWELWWELWTGELLLFHVFICYNLHLNFSFIIKTLEELQQLVLWWTISSCFCSLRSVRQLQLPSSSQLWFWILTSLSFYTQILSYLLCLLFG